jgi:hypothetical protein
MKKILLIGFGVLLLACLIFAAHHVVRHLQLLAYDEKIFTGLTHDLGDFYGAHNRLPSNWTEFASWSSEQNSPCHWKASELEPLFALQWGATVSSEKPPDKQLFIVLDRRDFAGIEATVNNELYLRCLESLPIRQNQVTHP